MCGIAGIINKNNNRVQNQKIESMNDSVYHRGPDGEGYYFGENFAFAHRRLSIIDLSNAGQQPMSYLDKYYITYNGEIFNYKEIKKELIDLGYKFKTKTDTEVIIASYDKWGPDCVNHFNGMWAFSIFDKEQNILFCSRDRFGIKPFYFTETEHEFLFGSEIKQLLPFLKKKLANKKILIDYLMAGFEDHTNETFFQNILKLEQSHSLTYDLNKHRYTIDRYYTLKKNPKIENLSENIIKNEYSKCFEEAIKLRLRADVRVGTCLSGGLDSSSIASSAAKIYNQKNKDNFSAIHAKSGEKKTDESYYAKLVADKSNIDLFNVKATSQFLDKNLELLIRAMEEPFGSLSCLMQLMVMQKAKNLKIKVLMDGQGGDESLLGYERYLISVLIESRWKDKLKAFKLVKKNSILKSKDIISYYLYFRWAFIRIFFLKVRSRFIKKKYRKILNYKLIRKNAQNFSNIFKLQRSEISKVQLPHLLKYSDKLSMYHSVESRLPFLDYKLVEFSLSLNYKIKIRNGWSKYILRKSFENTLGPTIAWRKNKIGFEPPSNLWFKNLEKSSNFLNTIKQSKILKKITSIEKINNLNDSSKWRLYNIAVWENTFNVEIH